jgi:hypothetical protein
MLQRGKVLGQMPLDEAVAVNVSLTPPVEIALRTLGEEDRRRVSAWFDHLKNWRTDAFVREHSQKLGLRTTSTR